MERHSMPPRPAWQKILESLGCQYHTTDLGVYWDESTYYSFGAEEIEAIERATNELHEMFLAACQLVIDENSFSEIGIPERCARWIRATWETEPPSVYGRFDLVYRNRSYIKVLEYNANTPTSLLEASLLQWNWKTDAFRDADQFNSIHEKLIEKWRDLYPHLPGGKLYLTSMDTAEDMANANYMAETARAAGLQTKYIRLRDIGYNGTAREFRDLEERSIRALFSLYPWEWLFKDFGDELGEHFGRVVFIEPAWKMLLSNKGLLAVLWKMYPNHPYLLESYMGGSGPMRDYVKKPAISREGANITLHTERGYGERTSGPYGGPFVFQEKADIPCFGGYYPVIGSWHVTDFGAAGMGIREDKTQITSNASRFVPHIF